MSLVLARLLNVSLVLLLTALAFCWSVSQGWRLRCTSSCTTVSELLTILNSIVSNLTLG